MSLAGTLSLREWMIHLLKGPFSIFFSKLKGDLYYISIPNTRLVP